MPLFYATNAMRSDANVLYYFVAVAEVKLFFRTPKKNCNIGSVVPDSYAVYSLPFVFHYRLCVSLALGFLPITE